jgi:hypothetical protein
MFKMLCIKAQALGSSLSASTSLRKPRQALLFPKNYYFPNTLSAQQ